MPPPRRQPRSWFENPKFFGTHDESDLGKVPAVTPWDRVQVRAARAQANFMYTRLNMFQDAVDAFRSDRYEGDDGTGGPEATPMDLAQHLVTMTPVAFWDLFRGRTSMTVVQQFDIMQASENPVLTAAQIAKIDKRGMRSKPRPPDGPSP